MGLVSSLIQAGTSLLGGMMGQSAADKQADLQKQFAQKGIQWKVADAKAAGIHPLYALGANTVSYSPVSVGGGFESALPAMGQDISRAVEAVASAPERAMSKSMELLQLENAKLQNDMLKAQIAGQVTNNVRNAQVGPPMPILNERLQGPQRTTSVRLGGKTFEFDPGTSDIGQIAEDRYGEGPASWAAGTSAMWNDFLHNMKGKSLLDILRTIDRATSITKYNER